MCMWVDKNKLIHQISQTNSTLVFEMIEVDVLGGFMQYVKRLYHLLQHRHQYTRAPTKIKGSSKYI